MYSYQIYNGKTGMDGNDLGCYNLSLNELKNKCNNDSRCMGFGYAGSGGCLKYYMGPLGSWRNNANGFGYVKNSFPLAGYDFSHRMYYNIAPYKTLIGKGTHEIAAECTKDSSCKAFNTAGQMYNTIPSSVSWVYNWGDTVENSRGLYVKDKTKMCQWGMLDPFGNECKTHCNNLGNCYDINSEFCTVDKINSNANCKKWILDNQGHHDYVAGKFCDIHPSDPFCNCIKSEITCPNKFDKTCIPPSSYKTKDMLVADCPPVMTCNQFFNLSPESKAIAVNTEQNCTHETESNTDNTIPDTSQTQPTTTQPPSTTSPTAPADDPYKTQIPPTYDQQPTNTNNGTNTGNLPGISNISNASITEIFNKYKLYIIIGFIFFILLIILIIVTASSKKNRYDEYDDYDDYY